jgi:hypothetical protein
MASGTQALAQAQKQSAQMREIAQLIYENPDQMGEFERDPEAFAKRVNGFEPPEGFHLHIADAQNNLFPQEEPGVFGAENLPDWSRIEFRVGFKTVSLVMCGS